MCGGSARPLSGLGPLHLVSAWASANHLLLGQVAVDSKSNEITAIPAVLDLLTVHGAVVTIDAMGCQKEIAAKIRERHCHYVLAVKDNQPNLLADIQEAFLQAHDTDFATCYVGRTVPAGGQSGGCIAGPSRPCSGPGHPLSPEFRGEGRLLVAPIAERSVN